MQLVGGSVVQHLTLIYATRRQRPLPIDTTWCSLLTAVAHFLSTLTVNKFVARNPRKSRVAHTINMEVPGMIGLSSIARGHRPMYQELNIIVRAGPIWCDYGRKVLLRLLAVTRVFEPLGSLGFSSARAQPYP